MSPHCERSKAKYGVHNTTNRVEDFLFNKINRKKYWRGFFNFSEEKNWNFIYDDSIDENFKFFNTFNYVHAPTFEILFEGHF